MNFCDTLAKYGDFSREHSLPWVPPAPLVNLVDHKAFNYSLEEPILREFGSYLGITHDYSFSTCQPCIRGADISLIKKRKTRNHLALFHIFPTAFFLVPHSVRIATLQQDGIKSTFDFLASVGIDLSRLTVTYFAGGYLDEVSQGQVPVRKYFPPDEITAAACAKAGLASGQLVAKSNLDNFVATFEGDEDFFAGYRYEIFHPLPDGNPLEIVTGEALAYRQTRSEGITVDVLPASCCAVPVVVGMERLHAILEGSADVRSIASLSRLASKLRLVSPHLSDNQLQEAADFFRAAHLVLAQTHNGRLNKNLAEQRRTILSNLCRLLGKRAASAPALENVLEFNASLHPWLPELRLEIASVAKELVLSIQRRKLDA